MKIRKLGILFPLLATLAIPALAQSSDPDNPTPLSANAIEGKVGGAKQSVRYYRFTAGPGDVKVSVDASTDYYSTTIKLDLLSAADSTELGSLSAMAANPVRRSVQTFTLNDRQPVVLKIATPEDKTVKWLQYKVRVEGAVELDTAVATPTVPPAVAPDAHAPVDAAVAPSPAVAAEAAPSAEPAPVADASAAAAAAPAPASVAGTGTTLLERVLGGLPSLPATGFLVLEMKDGTVQQIDLSKVKRMSVRKGGA
jgi:hypothetical protein